MQQVTAIIPMRHSSERVPGKNYRQFSGYPLFMWVVRALAGSDHVREIVIDTDSPTVVDYTQRNLPDVRVLERPLHLRDGHIAMNQVITNTLTQLEGEVFLQTHSTNPFLSSSTIDRACREFFVSEVDSLFSVTPLRGRFWWDSERPVNHDPAKLERTQDVAPIFEENSALYIFRRDAFEAEGARVTKRRRIFEIPRIESIDIDTEDDWLVAEAVAASRRRYTGGAI